MSTKLSETDLLKTFLENSLISADTVVIRVQTQEGVHTLSAMTAGIRRNWIQAVMKNVRPSTAPDVARSVQLRPPQFGLFMIKVLFLWENWTAITGVGAESIDELFREEIVVSTDVHAFKHYLCWTFYTKVALFCPSPNLSLLMHLVMLVTFYCKGVHCLVYSEKNGTYNIFNQYIKKKSKNVSFVIMSVKNDNHSF